MNGVLWLVYFADVSHSLAIVAGIGAILATLGCFFAGFGAAMDECFADVWPYIRRLLPWIAVCYLVCIVTPSRSFLYMAAGLRAGSEVAQTELGQKAYRLLDKKIDELLGEGAKE